MGRKKPLLSLPFSLSLFIYLCLAISPPQKKLSYEALLSIVRFPPCDSLLAPHIFGLYGRERELNGVEDTFGPYIFHESCRAVSATEKTPLSLSTRDRESVSLPTSQSASQAASHSASQPAACASIEIVCRDRTARNIEY